MKNISEVFLSSIGKKASKEILEISENFEDICEIKISVNKPLRIRSSDNSVLIGKDIFSFFDIRDIFSEFCEHSVHAYIDEIRKGFITSKGGYRIGICGTAVYENEKIINIKDISALNIRIPHEKKGAADKLTEIYKTGGILIIGPPCSGKTTLLRDFARQISYTKSTIIVDERNEISGTISGIPSFDIGFSAVLNGFSKSDGIEIAARTMSPEVIICDEFGGIKDIENSLFAMKSGADIVASMHSADVDDFLEKPFISLLLEKNIFKFFVFLNSEQKIIKIMERGDLIK